MAIATQWLGLIALAFVAGYAMSISARVVSSALRTGRTVRRGSIVSRRERPIEFWGGVAFWVILSVIVTVACAFMMWAWLNRQFE